MIYKNEKEVVTSAENLSDEFKIMFAYRYFSLGITTLFFLVNDLTYQFSYKLFIIACLTISSFILNLMYKTYKDSTPWIIILILLETIGVIAILIPSGGLQSPFVWYYLNTILVTSILLNKYFCWISMIFFLVISIFLTYRIFYFNKSEFLSYVMDRSNLVLCLVLSTILLQMLIKYIKKIQFQRKLLAEVNKQLSVANAKNKETMNSLIELYQAVHMFTSQRDKINVINLIVLYAKKLVKEKRVCYYALSIGSTGVMTNEGEFPLSHIRSIEDIVLEKMDEFKNKDEPIKVECANSIFSLVPIRSIHKLFGILCVEEVDYKDSDNGEQMRAFTKLCALVLEKLDSEDIKNQLIISEEQNRIANEIHDSVLQRLFSISCGLFSLSKGLQEIKYSQTNEELNLIRHSIDKVMRELREKIYGLSWKKNGDSAFEVNTRNFITELKIMHGVDIDFKLSGNQELLNVNQKKALYRIICEGLGNAVRHGKAQKIGVSLTITSGGTHLEVTDDGLGFNIDQEMHVMGLGIQNIQLLVDSMEGNVNFCSKIGAGTRIVMFLPNKAEEGVKEGIIWTS